MATASRQRNTLWITLIFAAITLAVYWLTAHRTITWWIGSSYPAAAVCLGVGHPPGSLILTILGWLVAKLPLGITDIFSLNLFAGVVAAATVVMIIALAKGLSCDAYDRRGFESMATPSSLVILVAGLSVLTMALGETMWRYALHFQPHMLTALFTTFILWAMLNWWRQARDRSGWKWVFVILLLFGLDFSVHRTNLILGPGLLVWVLLRYPGALGKVKTWLAGISGLVLGGAFHLLLIPIAKADPPLNANDPSNWPRLYDYISLKQYGGGWLVNLFPRKAPFVEVQLKNYIDYFAANFAYVRDSWGVMTVLPLMLGVIGFIQMLMWRRRMAIGLLAFFLLASVGEVFYFNTPGEFFWPMDRHYLPSFVMFALFAAYGAGQIALYLWSRTVASRAVALTILLAVLISAPVIQFVRNYPSLDASGKTFARDYAMNVFNGVSENAILFVTGDDYWPFIYLQLAEEIRPDVAIISSSLTNTTWYIHQLKRHHPLLPISLSDEAIDQLRIRRWSDTTFKVQVLASPEEYRLPAGTAFPDSIDVRVPPSLAGQYLMVQDWFILHVLRNNRFRRPVYFDVPPSWLSSLCRAEGLMWGLMPTEEAAGDMSVLADNLLNRWIFTGYDDESVALELITIRVGEELQRSFMGLAMAQLSDGDTTAACHTLQTMERSLPPNRIPLSEDLAAAYDQFFESADCE